MDTVLIPLEPEKLLTLKVAADRLGIPYHRVQRAARSGLIPVYKFGRSRQLVRLSEILSVIEDSRAGGPK